VQAFFANRRESPEWLVADGGKEYVSVVSSGWIETADRVLGTVCPRSKAQSHGILGPCWRNAA